MATNEGSRSESDIRKNARRILVQLGLDRQTLASFILIGLAFVGFYFWRTFFLRHYSSTPIVPVFSLLFACCFYKLTRNDLSTAAKYILFTTGPLFGIYSLFLRPSLLIEDVSGPAGLVPTIIVVQLASIVATAIGFIRPAFFIIPLTCVYWLRRAQAQAYDFGFGLTDYLTVAETSIFLTLGLCLVWLTYNLPTKYLPHKTRSHYGAFKNALNKEQYHTLLIFFMITIHFGNYFYAGFAKLILNGGPLSWLLENEVHFFAMMTEEYTRAGISTISPYFKYIIPALSALFLLTNAIVCFGQLLSCIAFWNKTTIKIFSLFYDAFHIMIFMLSGILFWKWIILNTSIVLATKHINFTHIPLAAKILGILAVILSFYLFHIALLGWYNTRVMNLEKIYAITADGQEYPVPSNYFKNMALPFAQNRIIHRPKGFFPVSGSSNTRNVDIMRAAKACDFDAVDTSAQKKNMEWFTQAEEQISKHHRYVLEWIREHKKPFKNYDFYPHHIWSSPFKFNEFKELDKTKIVAYKVTIENYCVTSNQIPVTKTLKNSATHTISVL
jgi:hypothetical protein